MSEKDFWRNLLPKVLATVIAGIVLVVVGSLVTNAYIASATTDRSIRNEKKIQQLTDTKENRGYDDGIHTTLLNATISNAADIKSIEGKVDANQLFIVKELLEIKGYVKTN